MQMLPGDANSCAICDSGWLKMSGDTVCSVRSSKFFVCQLITEYSIILCTGFYKQKYNRNTASFILALTVKRAIKLIKTWQPLSPIHVFSLTFWIYMAKKRRTSCCNLFSLSPYPQNVDQNPHLSLVWAICVFDQTKMFVLTYLIVHRCALNSISYHLSIHFIT